MIVTFVRLKPGAWDYAHDGPDGFALKRSRRNDVADPGLAEISDEAAERLIEKGMAEPLDVTWTAVRVKEGAMLPGNDMSNDRVLRVVDGVDVPWPMSFAFTEAEFLLEHVATHRSQHLHIPEDEYRNWMRTQPKIAHLADADFVEPVPFIDRWTAAELIEVGLAEPLAEPLAL